jgi:hypothetical protein
MRVTRKLLLGLAAASAAAVCLPTGAAQAQCEFSTLLPIPLVVTTFYYDDRSELPPVPGYIVGPSGTWIYEETNGTDSLQRGGTHWTTNGDPRYGIPGTGVELPGETEICVQSSTPDKLWF